MAHKTKATGNVFEGYNRAVNVDASVRYKVFENLDLSVEGVNLTGDYRSCFTRSRCEPEL